MSESGDKQFEDYLNSNLSLPDSSGPLIVLHSLKEKSRFISENLDAILRSIAGLQTDDLKDLREKLDGYCRKLMKRGLSTLD
jgi:hypothetical protein